MDPHVSASLTLKILGKLAPWLLARLYSEEKLSALIAVDPMAQGECVNLRSSSHDATCWLLLSNLSPFDCIVDRVEARVFVDGGHATLHELMPERLSQTGRLKVLLRGPFVCTPEGIELAKKTKRVRIEIRTFIRCVGREFVVRSQLEDVRNVSVY